MRPATIHDLMTTLGCTQWPERWAELYDGVMDAFDAQGCIYTDPAFYDRLSEKYNVLTAYREDYKQAAIAVGKDENLSRLLLLLCTVIKDRTHALAEFPTFTMPTAPDGGRAIAYDMLPALMMCATYDHTYALLTSRKLPQKHIDYGMNRFDPMISTFKERYNGAPGAKDWTWYQRTAVDALLYQTGRLEVEVGMTFTDRAIVFEDSLCKGKTVAMATSGRYHRSGHLLGTKGYEDECGAFEATIAETDKGWTGYIFKENGLLSTGKKTLEKSRWVKCLEPGDPVVALHIPPGGGMTPQKVDAAFAEAVAFLAEYFPEFHYKGFRCMSWILDPRLIDILGADSNLGQFIKRFDLMCLKSAGRDALNYVFLHPNPATAVIADLPEETSLQRKLKNVYLSGSCIYETYGYIPKTRITD